MNRNVLIALFALCIIGCSGKPQAKSYPAQTVLRIIGDSKEAMALFQQNEETLLKEKKIRLEYRYPERLTDNLEEYLFASDEAFDLYILFPAKLPQYVERKMLRPLDRYLAANPAFTRDIIPIYRRLYMRYGAHDYGMVYDGDSHLLFYRKDLFQRFSSEYQKRYQSPLTPPKTWEEYDRIAHFLTRDLNGDGKTDLYGTASFCGDSKRYIWFLERYLSMGGELFDSRMSPLIQGPLGVRAIKEWLDVQQDASPPQSMYDWIDLNNAFLQGQVAMVVQWSDTARFSFDQDHWKSKVGGKVGWTRVPGSPHRGPQGGVWIGRILAISSQCKHPDAAWEVIRYMTEKETTLRAIQSPHTINDPFRHSHFSATHSQAFPNDADYQDFLGVLKQSLNQANADLMIPGGWEYMQALDHHLGLALVQRESPEQALMNTAKEWESITAKYGRKHQSKHYREWLKELGKVMAR